MTVERDESHVNLTRHCGKSLRYNEQGSSSRSSYLKAPTPLDRDYISGDLTVFSSKNGPLRAVKGNEERDESHVDLTRHSGKSAVTMSKLIHCVYLT